MRPARAGKQSGSDRKPNKSGERRAHVQGVQMLLMFPLVVAVTLLLAVSEIAKAESRRNRITVSQ
jgi:hypothetical protein